MAAHPGMVFAPALLRPDLWVAEVVYRPLDSQFRSLAHELPVGSADAGALTASWRLVAASAMSTSRTSIRVMSAQ